MQQQLALQITPSAQLQRGMPEGNLTATMAGYKALQQIQEDKKICSALTDTVHKLPPLRANAIDRRVYCELTAAAAAYTSPLK